MQFHFSATEAWLPQKNSSVEYTRNLPSFLDVRDETSSWCNEEDVKKSLLEWDGAEGKHKQERKCCFQGGKACLYCRAKFWIKQKPCLMCSYMENGHRRRRKARRGRWARSNTKGCRQDRGQVALFARLFTHVDVRCWLANRSRACLITQSQLISRDISVFWTTFAAQDREVVQDFFLALIRPISIKIINNTTVPPPAAPMR